MENPTETKPLATLRATAYHEAGHAIAFLYFNIAFDYVTIIPDEFTVGSVNGIERGYSEDLQKLITDADPFSLNKDLIEKDIITMLAGPLAQELFTGQSEAIGSDMDYEMVSEILLRVFQDEDTSGAYNQYTVELTKQFLAAEKFALEKVAETLLIKETLSFDECVKLTGFTSPPSAT